MMPQFLQSSFDMLRESQEKMVKNMTAMNPIAKMPGFEVMQAQQDAFLKAMTGGWTGSSGPEPEKDGDSDDGDLDASKKQLADLQAKLSKLK